jgi:hypothetical protein
MTSVPPRFRPPLILLAIGGALVLSSCGSGSTAEADGDDGIATLQSGAASDADELGEPSSDPTVSADEAALELSQCLRDEGLDVPDIGLDSNGNIDLRGALTDLGPRDDSFRAAFDACREILEGVGFGGGRAALADNTEIQDAMLEFSDCVREDFEDIPDLSLGAQGQGPGQAPGDGAPGGGRGTREAGFGDRSDRLAEQLGLDPEDPVVVVALDRCTPIIDQAFANAGVGQPGNGG